MGRQRTIDKAWSDESAFCSAHRALRLPGLLRRPQFFECAFRRVMADRHRVAVRVEVGLAIRDRSARRAPPWPGVLERALHLPSSVPEADGSRRLMPLVLQGPRLAGLYVRASTRKNWAGLTPGFRLVETGQPLVVIEFGPSDDQPASRGYEVVPTQALNGAVAHFGWTRTAYTRVPTWLISRGSANPAQLRNVRLALLRLHSQQAALDSVIRQLERGRVAYDRRTDYSKRLARYLSEGTSFVDRPLFGGVTLPTLKSAGRSNVQRYEYRLDVLRASLPGLREDILRRVEKYESERGSITNIVVTNHGGVHMETNEQHIHGGTFHGAVVNKLTAERIENAFNSFAASGPAPALEAAVRHLRVEVERLIAHLPDDEPGLKLEVAERLETLASQASKPAPLRDVLKVTGEGLIEAAKVVAEMASPIAAAVRAVLACFGL